MSYEIIIEGFWLSECISFGGFRSKEEAEGAAAELATCLPYQDRKITVQEHKTREVAND